MISEKLPILEIKHLSSSYVVEYLMFFHKKTHALKEINFSIAQGETLAITGDAGSGKTTLLKILNGEKTNFQGQILIHDKPIQDYERIDRVKFIRAFFPNPDTAINPHLRIRQALMLPLKLNTDLTEKGIHRQIKRTLEYVGLPSHVQYYYPNSLTQNQRIRLSLAHALILNPKILLVDATIEKLDPQLKAHLINIFLDIQEKFGTSIIICLNDLALIEHISDKILVLNHGNQEDYGNVKDIFNSPMSELTKRILISYQHEYHCKRP